MRVYISDHKFPRHLGDLHPGQKMDVFISEGSGQHTVLTIVNNGYGIARNVVVVDYDRIEADENSNY